MFLFFLLLMGAASDNTGATTGSPVYRFDKDALPWRSINDGVMGGLSSGRMWLEDGIAVFGGSLSLENNGGFSSIRSIPAEHCLAGKGGLVLRLRGDGRTYGLRLRTNDRFDGPSYQAALPTVAGEWTEVTIPFDTFKAVFRGRTLPRHPKLAPENIRTFGMIIADKQPGDFRLELDTIEAY
ncbi:MAG: CIA30 family protein [Acidobacteria bacterium]|uniref:CIA30 family protein n=1 Tax=Candidatus Polarisedimenticola svalbardensis TaxID=2886004 RepID=A0A8J6XVE9_9BACT|nr:CIA30 family protein [Candidatus Polarisedimenticola svalbardensis]